MGLYIALIHHEGSDFGVSFPDFPGCITAGKTLEEAKELAQEALQFHVEGMVEDGLSIPAPSALEAVQKHRKDKTLLALILVEANTPSRAVRFNATLPEALLHKVDTYAKHHGMTRSGFLAYAASKQLQDGLR